MSKKSALKERSNTEIAKSALDGIATFGVESSRLIGRGATFVWNGVVEVGGKAKDKAKDKLAK